MFIVIVGWNMSKALREAMALNPGAGKILVAKKKKIISNKKFQKMLTVTERDDVTPTERGCSVLSRHFIMAFSMLIG